MILTGPEIERQLSLGNIVIDPFDSKRVNPNSYDILLGDYLKVYDTPVLDVAKPNPTTRILIPEDGFELQPNELYIGGSREVVGSKMFVSFIEGKSSLGRLGLAAHITAGWIDTGFLGRLTLEMTVVKPLVIRRGMKIGQICFAEVKGEVRQYAGKYQGQEGEEASRSYRDFA